MRNNLKTKRGFIKILVIVIVALVILKFVFNIDSKEIIESKFIKDLISILKSIFKLLWDGVLIAFDFLKLVISKAREFISSVRT